MNTFRRTAPSSSIPYTAEVIQHTKSLKGQSILSETISLSIDHVQGDPFASPSHISVRHRPTGDAAFPAGIL